MAADPVGGRLARCPIHRNTVLVPQAALAAGDGDPYLGAVIAGRFAVLERLGSGSMGTVYRARQEAMGRDVAVKVVRPDRLLDSQAKTRFQREAHAMSLLASQNTVTVFDFGEIKATADDPPSIHGSLFLAMELLHGESVGHRIERTGRLELAEALMIVRHTLASLAEAHDKGVVHRDLKPDNLWVTRTPDGEPRCKVLDFGIAKLLTPDGRVDALETQAGTVFGTPRYMSPEQAQGKKLDARSDLYALGVILYHMLTGRPPFTDDDAVIVMAHHIRTVPKRPSEVSPELRIASGLDALVMRALDKDPSQRPQTAREFIDELERAASESGEGFRTLNPVSGVVARPASRTLLAVAAAIVLVVAGVFAFRKGKGAEGESPSAPAARPAVASERDATVRTATSATNDGATSATPTVAPSAPPSAVATPSASATSAKRPAVTPRYQKFDR